MGVGGGSTLNLRKICKDKYEGRERPQRPFPRCAVLVCRIVATLICMPSRIDIRAQIQVKHPERLAKRYANDLHSIMPKPISHILSFASNFLFLTAKPTKTKLQPPQRSPATPSTQRPSFAPSSTSYSLCPSVCSANSRIGRSSSQRRLSSLGSRRQ